ncbi:MAG: YcaQ family DNA glycosylase [Ardenticatenaceae bacterium]|nr:YcaQ family DNA glycosylase [Ardenticatenaceae bacterium]
MLTIDSDTARRFILGKQGLWPGRRWRGLEGTTQAMQEIEYLQLDPLQIIARSQDITLHSRVLDYKLGLWETVTYEQRNFFDWGSWLTVHQMDDLPHWRVLMSREHLNHGRIRRIGKEHAEAIQEMRLILQERGTVSNRDFKMKNRTRTQDYRGRKDSALALFYLWATGEVMTHHRENFERVYALTEAVAPAHLIRESDEAEAYRFLIKKEISFLGLSRLNRTAHGFYNRVPTDSAARITQSLLADGHIMEVRVEGRRPIYYVLGEDVDLLQDLSAGRVPELWEPVASNTTEEVSFLAPLDPVSARGRAKELFDFEYVWEVYKPVEKRQYGYYTLPVLWGDQLVARFDSKLDRTTNTFVVLGFWLEDAALGQNEAFAEALARGFARFVTFLGADQIDVAAIEMPLLRKRVAAL